ncbi:hypothetical protein GCM10017714_13370 [Curtobacterium pusillum]|uniref:Uncharacterized protein n=1 Tax=Curtobacterium pusillum TaxID=69373 RepID=A0ABX2M4T2_9MICO|nr:hypothetical protein [Curtobacterium pusillum]NUU13124.1 hypothetical protein [Curtobacterium pusillum]GLK30598.1 hypothetical protein GCM10017610_08830 [Curtobacterium pusillum]
MHREFDQPPRRWPWAVVMLAGGIIGALEAFGIVGVTWVSDPTVDQPIVTEHDWWPPDSALLVLVAIFAIPAGLLVGGAVAAGVHALTMALDDMLGLAGAVVVAGMLTAAVGFAAGLPIATLIEAPPVLLPFAATAAGISGALLSAAALRSREPRRATA